MLQVTVESTASLRDRQIPSIFAWFWRHACVSQKGPFVLPFNLENDQIEAIGILLSLPRIYVHETQECGHRCSNWTIQHLSLRSRNSRRRKDVVEMQNIPHVVNFLQLWIRNIRLNGIKVSWLHPVEFC